MSELSTSTLKYLLAPYYLGSLLSQLPGREGRLARVKRAVLCLNRFLQQCEMLGILSEQVRF